jgi:menaquinone-dependent protoporphyrinogen oxidase
MVANAFREEGFTVEVKPANSVEYLDGYEAVILGGALYANRWHRDAKRLVKRHVPELRRCPTYLFSSGPLDYSATERDIPPVKGVQSLMHTVDARGHATFGGRLVPGAKGFVAGAMAKHYAGDWRDAEQVRSWVNEIVADLRGQVAHGAEVAHGAG